MKRIKTINERIIHEEEYILFLEKKINSKNFINNVSKIEYSETQDKLKKAKLLLRILKN